MKLALAQIDMRLGDIEGICSRIADQAALAAAAGAQLMCTPAPLFAGVQPTTLIDYANYEHDLVTHLLELAARVEPERIACLVPAVVSIDQIPIMECFLIRDGRVAPLRSMMAARLGRSDAASWEPTVFEIAGARIAVTLDFARDITQVPRGCDLLVYFQASGFDATSEQTSAVASVADGYFGEEVARSGVWLACMAPVGGFDETVFTGGSFVMDDGGRVVAVAPCFEEGLLVQDVSRGVMAPGLDQHELPRFNREEWLWEALRIHVRDTVDARGFTRVVVPLEGDLPSSLLAALAVDALGSRNVIGVGFARSDVFTPRQEALERERIERVRALAANLNIQLVERDQGDVSRWMDRDVPARDVGRLRVGIDAVYLADVAHELGACALAPITKTDAALIPAALLAATTPLTVCAPFGDVYLTELEFLARYRNRRSAAIPFETVSLAAVAERMDAICSVAVSAFADDPDRASASAALFAELEPAQIDGIIEAHVDRNLTLDDLPGVRGADASAALVLLLIRQGEGYRRSLPVAPIVSARAFLERLWPVSLGWSDLGRGGVGAERVSDLVERELERFESHGAEQGERVRGEIMNLLGGLLGLTPEQQAELASEEGQRRMRESAERFESQLRDALSHAADDIDQRGEGHLSGPSGSTPTGYGGPHFPFFSQN